MDNLLQELQKFVSDREWLAQLSKTDRDAINRVATVTNRHEIASCRYKPFFCYGSEEHIKWNVVNTDGTKSTLTISAGGTTDGLWFEMEIK